MAALVVKKGIEADQALQKTLVNALGSDPLLMEKTIAAPTEEGKQSVIRDIGLAVYAFICRRLRDRMLPDQQVMRAHKVLPLSL